jgi:hypothetical protein
MKLLLSVAAAALFFSTPPALAQTTPAPTAAASACGAIAPAPTLPDGASANYEEMERGNTAYNTWAATNTTVLECRRAEVEAVRARHEALRAEFTAGVDQSRAVRTTWEADVAEFNDRNPRSRTR